MHKKNLRRNSCRVLLDFVVFIRWLQGVIISLNDSEGVIKSEEHGELSFDVKENFSDVEFTAEDVNEEVEFTVLPVRTPPTAT